jgi:threonine/homoserine/homoserine lactone efflux protein
MNSTFFLRGLLIGFSIALPVGPIGVLCIRRTLTDGGAIGLLSGLGAASADAVYGIVAGFGLTVVSNVLVQAVWLRIVGGLFLCYLGIRTCLSKPTADAIKPDRQATTSPRRGYADAYLSTLFLTLTNPATIVSFAAVFAGLGLASSDGDYLTALSLVMGVFVGSAAWWLLLSSGVNLLRSRFNLHRLLWLNRISGLILLGFGIMALSLSR